MVLFTGAIFGAGLFLQKTLAPTPSELISIDFFQNNFPNLHLSSFFDCAGLHISFGRALASRDPFMHFSLFQKLMFLGYKFLLAISDEKCSRLFFVAFGRLDSSVDYRHMWTPQIQTVEIPLGDFSLAKALQETKSLHLNLWLFIPTPKGWAKEKNLHPRMLSQEITTRLGDNVGVGLYSGNCTWDSVDTNLEFERRVILGFPRWQITRLVIPSAESPQAILQALSGKVPGCKGIQCYDYPQGVQIEKL